MRRIPRPLATTIALVLALQLLPVRSLAEAAADAPADAAEVVAADDSSDAAVSETDAPDEPTLLAQDDDLQGDVNLNGKYLHYKDEDSGYWYSYTVTLYDVDTKTGTAQLSNVQYIKPDSDWGRDDVLPDGVEAASVDFTYPTTLSANVDEHQIDSMYPEASFTVTSLSGLPALPSFRSVRVPATVTELSGESYLDDNVTQVTFDPDCQITAIPKRYFENERQLEEPTLPATVETIGDRAFAGCAFASFTMPESLKSIGEGAFEGCGNLKTVTFNEGLENVGDSAFRNTMLIELNLPATLLTIGDYAFCKDPVVSSMDAFEGYSVEFQFDTVVIPDSVTSIGTYAFTRSYNANNTGLTAITSVTLGKGLKTIGQLAFQDASITTLELPASLETLDIEEGGWSGPFYGCALLEQVTFDDLNHAQLETMGGFTNCTSLASVEIPSSVTSIAPMAFNSCEALESITLPPTVTSIGNQAFVGTGLKRLTIPGSVKTIGESAFYGCESLSKLTLEEGVETIGDRAFDKNPALTSLVIPSTVSSIGDEAFRGGAYRQGMSSAHYQLESYGGGLTSLIIRAGDTPLSIGGSAFEFCEGLSGKTIVLPQRVSSIAGGAFLGIANATFEVYNPNIALVEGKSSLSIYDATAEQASALPEEFVYHNEDEGTYSITIPDPWSSNDYYVQNRLPKPNGSVVRYPASLTSETAPAFALLAANGSSDGYHPTYETFDSSGGDVPIEEPADVAPAGRLLVSTTGDAGINANVCVFDADGSLVTRARASRGYVLFSRIEPGTYTVVAFAKNDSFSTVSSLDAFATLGLTDRDYATKTGVKIAADQDTELTLTVPKLESIGSFSLIKSSSVAIAKQNVYQNAEFTATINYVMEDWGSADYLVIKLPKGVTPTSVASVNKNYGTGGFDEASRTLTVAIDNIKDQGSGRIYLGLRASTAGKKTVSASVVSGETLESGMTFPLGSASTTCAALKLEVPTEPVHGKTFDVTAYAAPHATITFSVAGQTIIDTTNGVGRVTVPIDLNGIDTTLTYTMVIATVGEGDDAASTSAMVEFALTDTEPYQLKDYSFIHAGKQYYIVQGGRAKPKTDYYIYIANGDEKNKYWTFEAVYESKKPLWIGGAASMVVQDAYATARVQMMDGGSRYVKMPITRSVEQADGSYLNYFGGSLYLDQAGDHVFFTSLIPAAFDVTLHSTVTALEFMDNLGAHIVGPTQADYDALRGRIFETPQDWAVRLVHKAEETLPADPEDEDKWDGTTDYTYVFFYELQEQWIWEYIERYHDEGILSDEEYAQINDGIEQAQDVAAEAGEVFDAAIGADKPIADCTDIIDWIACTLDFTSNVPYDANQLESQGFNVANDANAGSVSGGGTPSPGAGLTGNSFNEPSSFATKPTFGSDGSIQGISYRDSNGNSATIPVGKQHDFATGANSKNSKGVDWNKVSDDLTQGSIGLDPVKGYLAGIDAKVNGQLLSEGVDIHAPGKGSNLAGFVGDAQTAASVATTAINQRERIKQSEELGEHYKNAAEARGKVGYLDVKLNYLRMHGLMGSKCWKALTNERDWAIIVADGQDTHCYWKVIDFWRSEGLDVAGAAAGPATGGTGAVGFYVADKVSGKAVSNEMDSNQRVLNPALKNLNDAHRQRLEDCDEEEDDAPNGKNVILDPSGTVYEAFPANKLEGVKATVLEAGGVDAWNAGDYDQTNPQVTGTDGFFGWDVPAGDWQVRFEKDGYETYTTDPMQVPPPRTGLEIGLVATTGPQVASVTADTQSVEVVFDQWMDANTLYQVDVNGVAASDVEWADQVEGATGGQYFSKIMRLPVPAGTKVGNKLTVKVYDAENYAGKHLGEKTFENVEVKARPARLVMNFEDTLSLQVGTSRLTSVRVYDGEGNLMEGQHVTAALDNDYLASVDASSAVTNADGTAKMQLEALLPGMCTLTVGVEGSSLKRSIKLLTTVDTNTVARPTAKAGSVTIGAGAPTENDITVAAGTKLELSCETEGATIYYTTDGTSCPCQNTPARKTYTGPITLDKNVKLIVGAYKDGMDYSERLHINITAKPAIKKVNSIAITGISKKIAAGKKVKLTANVSPADATNKAVTWSSSNTKVAKVSATGVVTMAKKSGGKSVTITAVAKDGSGVKATYKIKSMKGVVKKIKVSGASSVKAGKSIKLKVGVTATKGANKKLKWTSSNTAWATVSSKGKVTAKKAGKGKTVKITCMATDGSNKKVTKKIKIK